MSEMRPIWAVACAALGLLVVACGATGPPAPKQQPPAELRMPVEPGEQTFDARWPVLEGFEIDTVRDRAAKRPVRLNVAKDLRDACALPEPYFEFDSAEVDESARAALADLADCFTTGPLRGRGIKLVGRADLSGDASYNLALGMRRAERVKEVLVAHGMAPARIRATSRGEAAVLGIFQGYTNADDRRVDIVIAP
jgi:outer membrane protein OmpA-like peptidoglycan-associated protein